MTEQQVRALRDILQTYLTLHIVEHTTNIPSVVSPLFLIEKANTTAWRLIVDLRALNFFVKAPRFQMKGIQAIVDMTKDMGWMASLDVSSAFSHVPAAEDLKAFLGFRVDGRFYKFKAMPFGLAASPHAWNILRDGIQRKLDSTRIVSDIWVDDCIVFGKNKVDAAMARAVAASTFKNLGVSENQKGIAIPVQVGEHLGFVWDLKNRTLGVTQKKVDEIRRMANKMVRRKGADAQELMRIAGKIQALAPACLPARLRTRSIYTVLTGKRKGQWVPLTPEARTDLTFWSHFARPFWTAPLDMPATKAWLKTDAAKKKGWGGTLSFMYKGKLIKITARGFWKGEFRLMDIAVLETWSIWFILMSLTEEQKDMFRNMTLVILTDSSATVGALLNTTSRSPAMMKALRSILPWLWERGIRVEVYHIRGIFNVEPDQLSREADPEDWAIMPIYKEDAEAEARRKATIDRFASENNYRCPRFNSRWACPGSEAIDAMTQDWRLEVNWVNSPFSMIAQVLKLIEEQRAETFMVLPVWPNKAWWRKAKEMASRVKVCPANVSLFAAGVTGSETYAPPPSWRVVIIYVESQKGQRTSRATREEARANLEQLEEEYFQKLGHRSTPNA